MASVNGAVIAYPTMHNLTTNGKPLKVLFLQVMTSKVKVRMQIAAQTQIPTI